MESPRSDNWEQKNRNFTKIQSSTFALSVNVVIFAKYYYRPF